LTPPEWRHTDVIAGDQLKVRGSHKWEKEYVRKDGRRVPVLLAVAALEDGQSLSITLDLSPQKVLEDQLRQSQKMEAVGSLAGGVAHDFNNLLSIILSYTSMVLDDLKPGDPVRADLEEVKRAGERATELTRQLLAFSRKQVLQPKKLDINNILGGMD